MHGPTVGGTCEDNSRGQAMHGPTVCASRVATCPGISKIRRLVRMGILPTDRTGAS